MSEVSLYVPSVLVSGRRAPALKHDFVSVGDHHAVGRAEVLRRAEPVSSRKPTSSSSSLLISSMGLSDLLLLVLLSSLELSDTRVFEP